MSLSTSTADRGKEVLGCVERKCLSVAAHNGLGASHIFMFGTEAQKQTYLVPQAQGLISAM